jgi:hypothetical protein
LRSLAYAAKSLFAVSNTLKHRFADTEEDQNPCCDQQQGRSTHDAPGSQERRTYLCKVDLRHNPQTKPCRGFISGQDFHASVVESDQGSRTARQRAAHGFSEVGLERDAFGRTGFRVTKRQHELDIVTLALRYREFASLAEALGRRLSVPDLRQGGLPRSVRIARPIGLIKTRDGGDEPRGASTAELLCVA